VKTYIPEQAFTHLPTLVKEKVDHWNDHRKPEYLPALIEHESCISLKHSKCWNAKSRLKSAREEGAGLGQITRAYTSTGALRFDALAEIRDKHRELKDFSWHNVYTRPDLQIRAVVLKMRDNYQYYYRFTDEENALAFADAAYNGGIGGVDKERRACKISSNCNPAIWFGNVENFCMKSKAALYGQRSACDINRHHVSDVLVTRSGKYKQFFK
jgi:hypothetical protein